eukprot:TRINITY_DN18868_c0_g1_i1.p1 TRINITY_DN18868_c0_g1~~TRINITY_DN18868_c0_g1_i1.p1  ORF type:complete len:106 (+),score=17.46 TRINITY_DN18868_c0_g1_i1:119-436(+)
MYMNPTQSEHWLEKNPNDSCLTAHANTTSFWRSSTCKTHQMAFNIHTDNFLNRYQFPKRHTVHPTITTALQTQPPSDKHFNKKKQDKKEKAKSSFSAQSMFVHKF